jgi:hypothetical protein
VHPASCSKYVLPPPILHQPITNAQEKKTKQISCAKLTHITQQGLNAHKRYRLRKHRANSVVLTSAELVEIRAAQRTFEGAYVRTALGQFSFALIVLKIFTSEFYSIGALFAVYGAGVLCASLLRRQQGNKQFFSEVQHDGQRKTKFRTSGNVVMCLTGLSLSAYVTLLILTFRLGEKTAND